VDTDDLLAKSIDAGERIVWCDRPHRLGGAIRRAIVAQLSARGAFALGGLLVSIGAVVVVASARVSMLGSRLGSSVGGSDAMLLTQVFLGIALIPVAVAATFFLQRLARVLDDRYAATDKGRGILVEDGRLAFFDLPPPESITTRTPGNVEHGDVELGEVTVAQLSRNGPRVKKRVTLHDVSYPLIAVESLRQAARRNPLC
jgi:hypothetical protein